jgi:PKD repeat protein
MADAGGSYSAQEGVEVTLDGSGSTGSITEYRWDIDDDGTYDYSSASPTQGHTFTAVGQHTVGLQVTDGTGTHEDTAEVTVSESTPDAGFSATPTSGPAPLTVTFTDSSTAYDAPIALYQWDFDNDGTIDSTAQNPVHIYNEGLYSVALTVTDSDGDTNTLTRTNYIDVSAGGCAGQPVDIGGAGYNTIAGAYAVAGDSDVILVRASDSYTENITLNRNIAVTLRGGYDCGYITVEGVTVLNGTITIESGTVTIENIEIQ